MAYITDKNGNETRVLFGSGVTINNISAAFASETEIHDKEVEDKAISPKNIDQAVKECTHHQMTGNRDNDLAVMLGRVSTSFGPDASHGGPDPQNLPVSYDAIRSYVALQVEKYKPTVKLKKLEVGQEYTLKQDYQYEIHGYGDNGLAVRYAAGPSTDTNALDGIEFVDDIDAVITSTYADNDNYWQMLRCWIKVDDAWRKKFDWQQFPAPALKVVNVFTKTDPSQTGTAYIYEYGVHLPGEE